MPKISVAVATFNEEKNIEETLKTVVDWVDEIVIVDGSSTDKTREIAVKYKAKVIIADNPPVFHINKQKAIDVCSGDWILQLDADERVTFELKEELISYVHKSNTFAGYYLPRKNFFLGHWLRKGGQYPDYVIRFFLNGKGKFPCKTVHEQIEIDGQVSYAINPLLHYPYNNLSEYWIKAARYSLLTGRELAIKKTPINLFTLISYFLVKPWMTFFRLYIRHLGFIDGWAGLLFAIFSSLQSQMAFIHFRKYHGFYPWMKRKGTNSPKAKPSDTTGFARGSS